MRKILTAYLPFALYAGLIYFVSSLSRAPLPDLGFDYTDKLAHLVEYGILGVLTVRAFAAFTGKATPTVYIAAIFFGILFAASDEFHQSFVPGRFSDFADGIADSIGTICGAMGYLVWNRSRSAVSG